MWVGGGHSLAAQLGVWGEEANFGCALGVDRALAHPRKGARWLFVAALPVALAAVLAWTGVLPALAWRSAGRELSDPELAGAVAGAWNIGLGASTALLAALGGALLFGDMEDRTPALGPLFNGCFRVVKAGRAAGEGETLVGPAAALRHPEVFRPDADRGVWEGAPDLAPASGRVELSRYEPDEVFLDVDASAPAASARRPHALPRRPALRAGRSCVLSGRPAGAADPGESAPDGWSRPARSV